MTQLDARPTDCRFRLRDENKPYPKSGCKACGATVATGLVCAHQPQSVPVSATQVTQADREAAWPLRPSCYKDDQLTREKWNAGVYDASAPPIRILARHREQAVQEAVAPLQAEIEEQARIIGAGGERELALMAQVAELKPWREAIDDALVCAHLGTADSFPDAKTALHKLICWEIDVALDPRVSDRARDLVAERDAEIAELREALWLFREFTIRNATQWQSGANHHHPIYMMIAELVGEMGGIASGQAYRFIQPDNRAALKEIYNG